jgi:hypothetical protein
MNPKVRSIGITVLVVLAIAVVGSLLGEGERERSEIHDYVRVNKPAPKKPVPEEAPRDITPVVEEAVPESPTPSPVIEQDEPTPTREWGPGMLTVVVRRSGNGGASSRRPYSSKLFG